MEENAWVPTLDESHLLEDTINLVSPKGVSIILIKKEGQTYALRNRCAHMACTLAGGRLDGFTIQCPCHEWKFDITTGEFIDARCGHMSGPLEMGALDGTILTCPMHHVQFDVTTGEALNHPVPVHIDEPLPSRWAQYMAHFGMLMQHTSVCNIKTFLVRVDRGAIQVEI